MKEGFSLIELLVVVLIIGILAAVALPQYSKAVEKSRATQAWPVLKSLHQAQKVYYMANGKYADSFDDLDIEMLWNGKEAFYPGAGDARSSEEWSLQIYNKENTSALYLGRISGEYKGCGFSIWLDAGKFPFPVDKLLCMERGSSGVVFKGKKGDYCQKIFQGNLLYEDGARTYSTP